MMRSAEEEKSMAGLDHSAMLAAYAEICKSYYAIDEFRMKLLGLLPLASIIGLVLVGKEDLIGDQTSVVGRELVGFVAIFAGLFTLALFGYEIRGIQRCHNLILKGQKIEKILKIEDGQFHNCKEEQKSTALFNAISIACAVYTIVFVAWAFVALRFAFGIETMTCVLGALVTGAVVAVATYQWVKGLTPA